MAVSIALVQLSAAAMRAAAKLWLGDRDVAADATSSAIDFMAERLQNHMDQRRLYRMMEQITDTMVERLEPILETEFRRLPENERTAAILAVRDTINRAPLRGDELFAGDLDANYLDRYLRSQVPGLTRDLSQSGRELYGLLLRESCGYIIEIARGLPSFSSDALTEVLRRETEILVGIREILSRLPQRQSEDAKGVIYDYRQLVARILNEIEVFGASVTDASRRYPLSVAYLSLTAISEENSSASTTAMAGQRIESFLASTKRLFIRGEAGLGKTTLLQWIAVRSAERDFSGSLRSWNDAIPFLVPLRRYNGRELPAPEEFLDEIGRNLAAEMPRGWVQRQLREGRGAVLIDGVDELSIERRNEAREWLRQLISTFPNSRYVVTSRPGAASSSWLSSENFMVADLRPMSNDDIEIFITRWHEAVKTQYKDPRERLELDSYREDLAAQISSRDHLRKIAGYPLLCALLCALHRERRAALPGNRMELYEVALQMLLERRDAERKIPSIRGLDRTEKTLLLSDIAYWLLRNRYVDAERGRVVEQLTRTLRGMTQVEADANTVYLHLLERSGLLREPVEGRVDFVHRTFQEYLAAKAAIWDADDIGALIEHAERDDWHEVIVMAAGHASRNRRAELITRLLDRGDEQPKHRDNLHLLALACLETAPQLDPNIRTRIEESAAKLLPPKSVSSASSFAAAGPFVLGLLADTEPSNARETAGTIRAAVETGLPDALSVVARFGKDSRASVQNELVAAWGRFNIDEYARAVLADLPLKSISTDSEIYTPSLIHLKHIIAVKCRVPSGGSLEGIPSQVTSLRLAGEAPKLETLQAPHLEELFIDTTSNGPIRVTSLGRFTKMTSLTICRGQVEGCGILSDLAQLRYIRLLNSISNRELQRISPAPSIQYLSLEGVEDLSDLDSLKFLVNPRELRIARNGRLSVEGVARWKNSLRTLALRESNITDLAPLSALKLLTEVDLKGTVVTDATPLLGLINLTCLTIDSLRSARDLHQLSGMGSLRTLKIGIGGAVDLAGLAGMRNLTVMVELGTIVRGEHVLDPTVRVRRSERI